MNTLFAKNHLTEVILGFGILDLGVHPVKCIACVFCHVVRNCGDVGITAATVNLFCIGCVCLKGANVAKLVIKGSACFVSADDAVGLQTGYDGGNAPKRSGNCTCLSTLSGCVKAVYKAGNCIGSGKGGNFLIDVACLIEALHICYVFSISGSVHVEKNLLFAIYFIFLPHGVNAECRRDCINKGGVSIKGKRGLAKILGHRLENCGELVKGFGNVKVQGKEEVIVENNGVLDVVAGCALGNTVNSAVNRYNFPRLCRNICKQIGSKYFKRIGDVNEKILVNEVAELILCELHCIIRLFVHQLGVKNLCSICSGELSVNCLVAGELLDQECIGVVVNCINALTRVRHKDVELRLLCQVDIIIDVVSAIGLAFAGSKNETCGQKHSHAKNEGYDFFHGCFSFFYLFVIW